MDILPLSSGQSHQMRRPVFISGFQLPVEMAGPPPARQQEVIQYCLVIFIPVCPGICHDHRTRLWLLGAH